MKTCTRLILAAALSLATPSQAANIVMATGKVVAGAEADGSTSEAPAFSGLTLVRHQVAEEAAFQMAGPDPAYPGKIFTKQGEAYFLTDAGSQWASPLVSGQQILAVLEAFQGQNGWNGPAFAGSNLIQVDKGALSRSLVSFSDTWISKIPVPSLIQAENTKIRFKIGQFDDLSGQSTGLSLWKREIGVQNWSYLASVQPGDEYEDSEVQGGKVYEYSASVNYAWPGGKGQGSRPTETGLYSTHARGIGYPMAAGPVQPTPTPVVQAKAGKTQAPLLSLPEGWLAYPNPVQGSVLQVAYEAPWAGQLEMRLYTLTGSLAKVWKHPMAEKGQGRVELGIKETPRGIYIMKLFMKSPEYGEISLSSKKIAIVH